jgi:hypothetical protein
MAIQQPERVHVVQGARPDSSWVRVGRGLHRLPDHDAFLANLRAWEAVLPAESGFTHVTALRARGLWVPQLPRHTPVFASMSRDNDRRRRPEIRTLRHTSAIRWTMVDGVRVAVAAEAVLVCARDLSPLDLVMVADGAVHLKACSVEELVRLSRARRWGAPALRRILPLVDGRAESPWETVLRLFHRCSEVPVEPQVELFDGSGRFVARADLLVRGRPWVHEYDGAGHRDQAAHASDLRRDRALLGIGYVRRGFTAGDLTVRAAATMREVDEALGRAPDPARLTRWRRLLGSSTLTPGGVRRLARRWHVDQ